MSTDILICKKNVRIPGVRDAVHHKLKENVLEGFSPSNLSVYANHAAFKAENHQPLDIADPLGDFGVDEELVVVAPAAFKRRRIIQESTHTVVSNSPYFVLDEEDTADSGLPLNHSINYYRPDIHKQFQFMQKEVLDRGQVGWIIGPPGTGKSSATFAFASAMDTNKWTVTWIHVSHIFYWKCVRLGENARRSGTFEQNQLGNLLQDDDQRHHLVLIDGLKTENEYRDVVDVCMNWFCAKQDRRRLVFVSTMTCEPKACEKLEGLARVADDDFFNSVSRWLDARNVTAGGLVSRTELVVAKYYYAGGSCRNMFYYDTNQLKSQLVRWMDTAKDMRNFYMAGFHSPSIIDRLYALFQVGVPPLISAYVAMMIGMKCEPEGIKKLISAQRDTDPVFNGWRLTLLFFASNRNGGLRIVNGAGNVLSSWSESVVLITDKFPKYPPAKSFWLKPDKWKQGGYDAIMVDKESGLVRFVQLTTGHMSCFCIKYFRRWLDQFSTSKRAFEIKISKLCSSWRETT